MIDERSASYISPEQKNDVSSNNFSRLRIYDDLDEASSYSIESKEFSNRFVIDRRKSL